MQFVASKIMQDFDIPSFRVKKSHKKSRFGCVRCKGRRVKCDETKPECKQCRRRGLTCTYAVQPGSSGSNSASPTTQTSPVDSVIPAAELGVSDTELLRHFFAHTCDTFVATSIRTEHADLWRIVIPALAYSHLPLRLGLLTAAALCISHDSSSDPEVAKKYFEVAKSHGERFVAESRAQARRFDPSEFDSILSCSRLLTLLGFAFYRTHRANGVVLADSAAWTWLHLLRGILAVHRAVLKSEALDRLDPMMSINMIPELSSMPGDPTNGMQWHRKHKHFGFVRDTQRDRIDSLLAVLQSRAPTYTTDEVEDLRADIVSLDNVTTHICTAEVHSVFRAICSWPGSMSIGFMTMLLENEPFALVVHTHWLMLVMLMNESWWFGDMGPAGVREVADICSCEDPSLESLLQWPKQMVEAMEN